MLGLWVFVLPYAVGAGEIWESLKNMNETNETEFLLAVQPTPAPTFPQTQYTMRAAVTDFSEVPSLASLQTAGEQQCSGTQTGCEVKKQVQYMIEQVAEFPNVACDAFTDTKAGNAVATGLSVYRQAVTSTVKCPATRRLEVIDGRHLQSATGTANIQSTIATTDLAEANTFKTAAVNAAQNTAALQAAFATETGISDLQAPTVQTPTLAFSVTYTVTSSTATAVETPSATQIANAIVAADPNIAQLSVTVDTPAPTPAPTVAPTPLPAGSTFAPTLTPTPAPATPAPPTPAPPTPAPPTPAPPTPAPPAPAPTPAPPTAAPTSAPMNSSSEDESGVTRSCLATAALSIVALAAFVASP